MEKKIKFKTLRTSFKREIFIGLIIAASIPVLITSFLLVNVFKYRLKSDYENNMLLQMDSISYTFNNYFKNIENISDQLVFQMQKNMNFSRFSFICEPMKNFASFNLFDKNGNLIFSDEKQTKIIKMPVYWGILKTAYVHPEKLIIKRCVMPEKGDIILQVAKAVFTNEDCIGFVVINISSVDIKNLLGTKIIEENDILLLDSFYEKIYSPNKGREETLSNIIRNRIFNNQSLLQKEDKFSFFIRPIASTGLLLVLSREMIFTDDVTQTMWYVIIAIGIFSFILCFFGATFYSNYLGKPVRRMTEAMNNLKCGDFNAKIKSSRQDELGQLANQFDNMIVELKNYMELKVTHQQELNDSNIAMMQAQLNPHFLYNTLDTMKWVAKANQVPVIAQMSSDLAQILRMSISEKRFITLKQELELVQKYVEIQQIRFSQNFSYDVECPMELEDCIIPKLIIQPVVENAVIHGLKENQKGYIFTNIFEENNLLIIEVSDNGVGMNDEIIQKINLRNRKDFQGHIGFYNVDTIIRLYYGDEYGLWAEKNNDGGTTLRITLPIKRGEAD